MSEIKELTISLENLHCSSCQNFLSSAPIQVLNDGNSICGNCSPLYANQATQRVLTLEAILTNFSFPCQFKPHGCEKELLFGHIKEHETECKFRCFNCPNNCLWKGPALKIYNHFNDSHPEAIARDIEIKLDIDQNKEEILISDIDYVKFIIKYVYCAESSNFWYNLKYISLNVVEVTSKIVLKNDNEEGYSIILKGDNCLPYDGNFLNPQNQNGIFLNNLLPVLNKPHRVLITIDLFVTKEHNEDEDSQDQTLIVDYNFLEKLRCKQCKLYLVPPVYIIEGTPGFLCYSCRTVSINCKPLQSNTMMQRWINLANYPCRWRVCEYVGKANNIPEHERACLYRIYTCLLNNCKANFKMNEAITHLQTHGYQNFDQELVYKICLGQVQECVRNISRKCNEIISIKRYTKYYESILKKEYLHKIMLAVPSNNKCKIKAKVQFEHAHCKIKSPIFIVKSNLYFGLDKMPGCFTIHDELTVTVKLQCDCLNV